MSNDPMDDQTDGQVDGQPEDQQVEERADRKSGAMAGVLGWVVSAVLHGVLVLLAGTVYFLVQEETIETPPVRVQQIEAPPKKEEQKKENRDVTPTVEVNVASSESDKPSPISDIKVPDEKTTSQDVNDAEQPKGREEAVASSEAGGAAAFLAIGAGGGASGMFGSRSGGGRKRAVGRMGGSKGSESAVESALRWFKKHQSPKGLWEADGYFRNCDENPKCEPGKIDHDSPQDVNAAMTGYALLCFLGAGYDHKSPNRFRQTIKSGLDYLISIQDPNGAFAKRNYAHPVATMALAEAYAMTGDPDLKSPAQKGVNYILSKQNQDKKGGSGGLGWDYVGPNDRNDSSVTGWNVMALKSAYAGQLNVGNGMEGSKRWLEKTWRAANPGWDKLDPYTGMSKFPYIYTSATDTTEKEHLAPVGMVCSVFLGHHSGDVMLETLANWVMKNQVPTRYPANTYFMYYNTLGIFQVGGDRWKTWNSSVREILVNAQRKGQGCFDGSWDWEGTQFHGNDIGRVLSTAYCCLCLEVYYRYAQVGAKH